MKRNAASASRTADGMAAAAWAIAHHRGISENGKSMASTKCCVAAKAGKYRRKLEMKE